MHFVVQNEMQVIVTHLNHTFEVHEGVFNIEPLALTKRSRKSCVVIRSADAECFCSAATTLVRGQIAVLVIMIDLTVTCNGLSPG